MDSPLLFAVVLSLFFGTLSAAIAANKNRSKYGWFFAGVLLGPFGLLVAVLRRIKPVVIVVDVQADFTSAHNGTLATSGSDESYLKSVSSATRAFKDAGLTVFATQDWHPANHMSFADNRPDKKPFDTIEISDGWIQTLWPVHCVQDTDGAALAIEPGIISDVIRKGQDPQFDSYSGFRDDGGVKTPLREKLTEAGAKSLIIYGIATDYCVKATVLDALQLGYKVCLVTDLCRGVSEDTSVSAIREMAEKGAFIMQSLDLKKALRF